MSNLVHNERTKLTATFFNSIGITAFIGGGVIPLFSVDPTVRGNLELYLTVGAGIGVFAFFIGFMLLGGLKE